MRRVPKTGSDRAGRAHEGPFVAKRTRSGGSGEGARRCQFAGQIPCQCGFAGYAVSAVDEAQNRTKVPILKLTTRHNPGNLRTAST